MPPVVDIEIFRKLKQYRYHLLRYYDGITRYNDPNYSAYLSATQIANEIRAYLQINFNYIDLNAQEAVFLLQWIDCNYALENFVAVDGHIRKYPYLRKTFSGESFSNRTLFFLINKAALSDPLIREQLVQSGAFEKIENMMKYVVKYDAELNDTITYDQDWNFWKVYLENTNKSVLEVFPNSEGRFYYFYTSGIIGLMALATTFATDNLAETTFLESAFRMLETHSTWDSFIPAYRIYVLAGIAAIFPLLNESSQETMYAQKIIYWAFEKYNPQLGFWLHLACPKDHSDYLEDMTVIKGFAQQCSDGPILGQMPCRCGDEFFSEYYEKGSNESSTASMCIDNTVTGP